MDNLQLIKKYFTSRNRSGFGLFEFGIHGRIFDCILIEPFQMKLRGFEFKVNRSDFLRDKNSGKWKKYLSYCNTFAWVCPKGLIRKEEVESPAGLLWISTIAEEYGYTAKDFYERPYPIWVKMPKRHEMPQKVFNETVLILIGRVKYRKEDFF